MEAVMCVMLDVTIELRGFGSVPTRRDILEALKADLEAKNGVQAYDADTKCILIG